MQKKILPLIYLLIIVLPIVLLVSIMAEQPGGLKIDMTQIVGGVVFLIIAGLSYYVGKIPPRKQRAKNF